MRYINTTIDIRVLRGGSLDMFGVRTAVTSICRRSISDFGDSSTNVMIEIE